MRLNCHLFTCGFTVQRRRGVGKLASWLCSGDEDESRDFPQVVLRGARVRMRGLPFFQSWHFQKVSKKLASWKVEIWRLRNFRCAGRLSSRKSHGIWIQVLLCASRRKRWMGTTRQPIFHKARKWKRCQGWRFWWSRPRLLQSPPNRSKGPNHQFQKRFNYRIHEPFVWIIKAREVTGQFDGC